MSLFTAEGSVTAVRVDARARAPDGFGPEGKEATAVAQPACLPRHGEDGLAQALFADLENTIQDHEYGAATLPAERFLATPLAVERLARDQRVAVCLDLMTWAIKTGVAQVSFALQRKALAALAALPAGSEARVRGELRLILLQAERARHASDVPAHFDATRRAVSHLLQHRQQLGAEERYLVVWEIARLIGFNGQREAASRMARRLADFAAAKLGEPEQVESAIFAHSVLLDLPGAITAALGLALPRIGEGDDPMGSLARVQDRLSDLRDQAGRAASVGVPRWAEGWAYRARCCFTTMEWALGGGRPDQMIAAMQSGFPEMRRKGNFCRQRDREISLGLSKLAADRAATLLREAPDQQTQEGIEGDYLLAAQHALAGRDAKALAAYARYAAGAHRRVLIGQRAISADLLATGEVLLALPIRSPRVTPGQDPIRVVCRSVRLVMEQGPSAALGDVAMEQGLSARRVQQAFKSVGLEAPSRFLRRLDDNDAPR